MTSTEFSNKLQDTLRMLYESAFSTYYQMSYKEVFLESVSLGGVLSTMLGYAIGCLLMLVMCTSKSWALKCTVFLISSSLLVYHTCYSLYPDNVLICLGFCVSIVCTYAQVESWRMLRNHFQAKKTKSE